MKCKSEISVLKSQLHSQLQLRNSGLGGDVSLESINKLRRTITQKESHLKNLEKNQATSQKNREKKNEAAREEELKRIKREKLAL